MTLRCWVLALCFGESVIEPAVDTHFSVRKVRYILPINEGMQQPPGLIFTSLVTFFVLFSFFHISLTTSILSVVPKNYTDFFFQVTK